MQLNEFLKCKRKAEECLGIIGKDGRRNKSEAQWGIADFDAEGGMWAQDLLWPQAQG